MATTIVTAEAISREQAALVPLLQLPADKRKAKGASADDSDTRKAGRMEPPVKKAGVAADLVSAEIQMEQVLQQRAKMAGASAVLMETLAADDLPADAAGTVDFDLNVYLNLARLSN